MIETELADRLVGAEVERRRWRLVHVLAMIGGLLLVVQLWTYGRWLAAGPYQITKYRDHGDVSWAAARFLEVSFLVLFVGCLVYVVRRCRRERRLAFDAKLMIASLSVVWLDPFTNFVAPIWLYSTQWMNLNSPLGYAPGVINPTLKSMPFPLFHVVNYPVALLMAGILVSSLMRRISARWPRLSTAQLVVIVAILGTAFDTLYELPFVRLHLWAFPGAPGLALYAGDSSRHPLLAILPAGAAFATFGAVRYFRNDRGEEITERDLEDTPARWRPVVSTLALSGVVQMVWVAACTAQVIGGLYAPAYPPMPSHLVGDSCDAPLTGGGQRTGTEYGPCPGEEHP